jgi:hypothetical protein
VRDLGLVAIDEIFHRAVGMVLNHIYLRRPMAQHEHFGSRLCSRTGKARQAPNLAAAFGNFCLRATTLITTTKGLAP